MKTSQTIVAVATAAGSGGVGIIRFSGSEALAVAAPFAPGVPEQPTPRHAYFTEVVGRDGAVLDHGLFLFFRAPSSFTGEDVVELQTHGSPRLLQRLVSAALEDPRVRLAEPGEFTRRAFLNGRIDLARAEAVIDLVSADSDAALRAAAAQACGSLSEKVTALREPLLSLRADLEASLDFPVEAEGAEQEVEERLGAGLAAARDLLAQSGRGRLIRRGARVVLFGPVNAGKSTLFNQLLGESRALVDEEPGTTRDVLEAKLELEGLSVTLIDTAGLRAQAEAGRVEALGMERTRAALRTADLVVLVVPPGAGERETEPWLAECASLPLIRVRSKADLLPPTSEGGGTRGGPGRARPIAAGPAAARGEAEELRVSGVTGGGVEVLRELIRARLSESGADQAILLTSERHAQALRRATEALERAEHALRVSTLEVVSGELGFALEALGEITGETASDELLDAIFRRFCIGK